MGRRARDWNEQQFCPDCSVFLFNETNAVPIGPVGLEEGFKRAYWPAEALVR